MTGLIVFMIWIVSAVTAGILAYRKGRSVTGWVLLCLLLSPLILLPLVALWPVERRELTAEELEIQREARRLLPGSGEKPKPAPKPAQRYVDKDHCPECQGRGVVRSEENAVAPSIRCKACGGLGYQA